VATSVVATPGATPVMRRSLPGAPNATVLGALATEPDPIATEPAPFAAAPWFTHAQSRRPVQQILAKGEDDEGLAVCLN
jgi:hypothetical protein